MDKREWTAKQKYRATFDQLIENHLILMKFLKDNYGESAIRAYYLERNQRSFSARIGKTLKIGAKILKSLSSQKFLALFLDQMIKNVQYMIPLECLAGIDREEKSAVIHIENCHTKRVFRKSIRKFKLKNEIDVNAFCQFDCIPSFQLYGQLGNINISATFKDRGCEIFVKLED
ncbi:MAG: hypothetical protein ACTSRS_21070 [Candidatus Helarchaeota archaeon]